MSINILELSFVAADGETKDLWAVKPTGNWAADNATGRDAADELLALISETVNPIYLSSIAQAIVAKGRWSGVEVGFFTRIGVHTIS